MAEHAGSANMAAKLSKLQEQLAQQQQHQTERGAKYQELKELHGGEADGRQGAFVGARRLGCGGTIPAGSSGQRETAGTRYRATTGGLSPSIGKVDVVLAEAYTI